MKANKKVTVIRKSNLEKRREMARLALIEVKKLVAKYDLAAVQNAVKSLYDERKANKELMEAEAKVNALKRKLGV